MTLLSGLFDRRSSVENPLVPLTGANLLDALDTGAPTDAGIRVDEYKALQIASVWRAVNLIANTSASLPIHAYKTGTRQKQQARILDAPSPSLTKFELWQLAYASVLLWGNAFFLRKRSAAGALIELEFLNPEWVKVGRFKHDPILDEFLPSRKVFDVRIPGQPDLALTEAEVLHIPGFGYDGICGVSPIRAARQSLGLALAAEEFGARLFGNGSLMSGILQTEARLEEKDAEALKRRWMRKMAGLKHSHEIAVLDKGAKFQPIGIPPGDAQFIESRKFQISEIARWFGVPPHMLYDVEKSTSWGTGIEQQGIGFVVYTLRPWLTLFEQRISRDVLLNPQLYAKYSVEGLLRGDSATRSAFYASAIQNGWLNVDEVRELEDREPLPDGAGQTYLTPLNMAPAGGDPNAP